MSGPRLRGVAVVVPVRNEERLLGPCLSALAVAVDNAVRAGIRCEVRVVLDACTDGSAEVAAAHRFPVLRSHAARVGVARSVGVADALASLTGVPLERLWVATTDADSCVPPNWLTHQRALSRRADVYVGTVRPDFADLTAAHRAEWLRTHIPGRPNGHVHGANLGMRASVYLAAGGFAPIAEHEDVDLVARSRALGAAVTASDRADVLTSGRTEGRTPGGYAGFLRLQADELAHEASADD